MFKKLATVAAVGGLLSACSALENLETLQQTTPTGSSFSQALAKEYQKFAEFEAYEMKDWIDQNYFAKKGLQAAAGEVPAPEDPNAWDEPADKINLLNGARSRLVTALDNGGRDRFPAEAALAQAKYDCWVEQQEENHQPKHIEECQKEFTAAMEALEALLAPAPEPAPEPAPAPAPARPDPVTFMIFFGFDSADLDDGAKTIAGLIAERAAEYGNPNISIVGHTDTSGSADYNMALAGRRALSVRSALEGLGISSGALSVDAVGEDNLMVETADGVKSAQNRRATVTIE